MNDKGSISTDKNWFEDNINNYMPRILETCNEYISIKCNFSKLTRKIEKPEISGHDNKTETVVYKLLIKTETDPDNFTGKRCEVSRKLLS